MQLAPPTVPTLPPARTLQVLPQTSPADIHAPPEDGTYIYGLYLEGAAWDPAAGTLCEQAPQALLFEMPLIWIKPHVVSPDATGSGGHGMDLRAKHVYQCPVYRTALRRGTLSTTGHSTMWVMNVLLPIAFTTSPEHYVKRGAALLCQTSE